MKKFHPNTCILSILSGLRDTLLPKLMRGKVREKESTSLSIND